MEIARCLLASAAVLAIANAVLLWRNVTLNRELRGLVALTEANRQAADRLAETLGEKERTMNVAPLPKRLKVAIEFDAREALANALRAYKEEKYADPYDLANATTLILPAANLSWLEEHLKKGDVSYRVKGVIPISELPREEVARHRTRRLGDPPIPYTPGMSLKPGQSTVIEIPLTLRPRERSY